MPNIFKLIIIIAIGLALVACGQTGPLYLPGKTNPPVKQHTVVKP